MPKGADGSLFHPALLLRKQGEVENKIPFAKFAITFIA